MKLDLELKAEALEQIKKRASVQFNWDDEPYVEVRCLRLFRRAAMFARHYYRLHQWENLPRIDSHADVDDDMPDAITWQNSNTIRMIEDEHKLTLARCFMAIGVEHAAADKIVAYIIAKEKAQAESE